MGGRATIKGSLSRKQYFILCDRDHNLDSLNLVVVLLVPLVDVSGQGGNELAGVGLSEGIEGVALGKRGLSIGRTMLHLPGTWGTVCTTAEGTRKGCLSLPSVSRASYR